MKKQIFALMVSTTLCSTGSVIAMEAVELKSTGIPVSFTKNPDNTINVTTDDNAEASYQAVSKRFPVVSGQTIKVDYDVSIAQGIMSIGLLATSKTAWYDSEVVLKAGNYKSSFTRIVPEGETETSLVLRNYHLGTPGQTIFTLNNLQMEIEPLHSTHRIISAFEEMETTTAFGKVLSQYTGEEVGLETLNFLQNKLLPTLTGASLIAYSEEIPEFVYDAEANRIPGESNRAKTDRARQDWEGGEVNKRTIFSGHYIDPTKTEKVKIKKKSDEQEVEIVRNRLINHKKPHFTAMVEKNLGELANVKDFKNLVNGVSIIQNAHEIKIPLNVKMEKPGEIYYTPKFAVETIINAHNNGYGKITAEVFADWVNLVGGATDGACAQEEGFGHAIPELIPAVAAVADAKKHLPELKSTIAKNGNTVVPFAEQEVDLYPGALIKRDHNYAFSDKSYPVNLLFSPSYDCREGELTFNKPKTDADYRLGLQNKINGRYKAATLLNVEPKEKTVYITGLAGLGVFKGDVDVTIEAQKNSLLQNKAYFDGIIFTGIDEKKIQEDIAIGKEMNSKYPLYAQYKMLEMLKALGAQALPENSNL